MTSHHGSAWQGRHRGKDALRERIWGLLKEADAVWREPVGHIPAFRGAEEAADRLAALPIWQRARVIKCNPDTPQIPVRLRALEQGKRLYMAVPRLVQERCFVELLPEELAQRGVDLAEAATAQGALAHGRPVAFPEMQPIDLVVTGCVAVTRAGGRTGKGAGFADLELGILREFGLVGPETPIVTTVHPLQLVDDPEVPLEPHDWPLDWIVTPDEVIETHTPFPRPGGLDWARVRPDQLASIPILARLREQGLGQRGGEA